MNVSTYSDLHVWDIIENRFFFFAGDVCQEHNQVGFSSQLGGVLANCLDQRQRMIRAQ